MNNLRKKFVNVYWATGLGWIWILIYEAAYQGHPREENALVADLQEHQKRLTSEQMKEVVEELLRLQQDEEQRRDKIESKATSLLSLTTVTGAFLTGLIAVVNSSAYSVDIRRAVAVLYGGVIASLIITILMAIKTIKVGKYSFMAADFADTWKRSNLADVDYYQGRARDLLLSYIHNRGIINDKAEFVSGAQDWFRNAALLLISLTIFITVPPAFYPIVSTTPASLSPIINTTTSTSTITPSATTAITPSATPAASPTVTP